MPVGVWERSAVRSHRVGGIRMDGANELEDDSLSSVRKGDEGWWVLERSQVITLLRRILVVLMAPIYIVI